MTIMELQERLGTEEACREYLFASRSRMGFGVGGVRAGRLG